MLSESNRAFKEWDAASRAMMEGRQTVLIRKGGIREEGGRFAIDDSEFWLMPTFDHQTADLLQPEYAGLIASPPNLDVTYIHAYALVDTIWEAKDDAQVNSLSNEMIWNEKYVKLRFDFNPYDPLFIVLLRIYKLDSPVQVPMLKAYGGCKSWVTLERPISTAGAKPVILDNEYEAKKRVITKIAHTAHC